ncbi:putative protein YEL023C [Saccharomyces cerevisiae S288c] [Rhizoctonia solani]|uniref:T6SS Phospholipase effector Tle1-like catalytic domain-containing protein n=1 Tax=Rhizoctonia solani TaxID=456999 RepID=A0A0K6GIM9_9AGAM|nr:putative protein YEL023C [Saccharomyces cerevisiae S288c] [Rhizoctonia solani]
MERIAWPSQPSGDSKGTELIVLCDGTGKNGHVDKDPTNVFHLYNLLEADPEGGRASKRRKRKVLYIPGVGAESKGVPKYLALVFGKTIVEMIIRAYMFIAENYRSGDSVCIFGYSRGAFVARKVAGLLHRIGVVGSRDELLTQWQRREKPVPWDKVKDTKHSVPIRCLGVWDTVGAIYRNPECEEKDLLGIPDAELPPNVEVALHVLAFHENRKRFRVTLFEPNGKSNLKQIWFPGAHSDVGGGGEKPSELPRVSLIWMIGELRGFMDVPDNERLEYPLLANLEPSDAYNDSPAWKRAVDKFETRLESKALQPTAKVHQTLRDIKQEAKSSHGAHRQLTFYDLLSLSWNIQTGLVLCNTLEMLKQSRITTKVLQKEHLKQDRKRVMSLPVFGARPQTITAPSGLKVADVQTESPTEEEPRSGEHRWSISIRKRARMTI